VAPSFLTAQAAGPPLPPPGARRPASGRPAAALQPWAVMGSARSTPLPSASWAVMGSARAGRCHGHVVVAWWRGGLGAWGRGALARSPGAVPWVVKRHGQSPKTGSPANHISSLIIYITSTY